jgi:hypothetical protein
MPAIERVGIATAKRPHPQRQPGAIGLREDGRENQRANATSLMRRADVEMLEPELIISTPDGHEANPLTVHEDVASLLRNEAIEEPVARSLRVEAPDALETFAHGLDSNGYELLEVIGPNRAQDYSGRVDGASPSGRP